MVEDAEKAMKNLEDALIDMDELCPICFTNKISRAKAAVANAINSEVEEEPDYGESPTVRTLDDCQTFEFCGIRTCVGCAIKLFKHRIDNSCGILPR